MKPPTETPAPTLTAFAGPRRVARGPLPGVALDIKAWLDGGGEAVLIFDDATGRQLDLDLRGDDAAALARLAAHPVLGPAMAPATPADEPRSGPGRPRLGVVCREVSLLPRHWDWLGEQRGGASAALRRLVEEQMKAGADEARARRAHEAAERFAWAMAGDLPGFEEAARALTRREYGRLPALAAGWPADIRDHLLALLPRTGGFVGGL